MRMLRFIMLLAVLFSASSGNASWFARSLEELVQDSDLIVIGTLRDVVKTERYEFSDNLKYSWKIADSTGTIHIDSVIWGPAEKNVKLAWTNGREISFYLCHESREYQKGIWLLQKSIKGGYHASRPDRFLPLYKIDEVIKAVEENPYCIHVQGPLNAGHPLKAYLILRNPFFHEITVPGARYNRGVLIKSAAFHLHASAETRGEETRMPLCFGHISEAESMKFMTIPGRTEKRIPVDLNQLFPLAQQGEYKVWYEIEGLGMSNIRRFCVCGPPKKKYKPSPFMKRLQFYFYKPSIFHRPEMELVRIDY